VSGLRRIGLIMEQARERHLLHNEVTVQIAAFRLGTIVEPNGLVPIHERKAVAFSHGKTALSTNTFRPIF